MKVYLVLFCLLFSLSANAQNKLTNYEYWFDQNYANKVVVSLAPFSTIDSISSQIPATGLTPGMHSFNIRFVDDSLKYSATETQLFLYSSNNITEYEYWMDDDYNNKISVTLAATPTLNLPAIINSLPLGLHMFNIRFKSQGGLWSSVTTNYVYNTGGNMVEYEYWVDSDYNNKVSATVTATPTLTLPTIINGILLGLHTFNIRYKNQGGLWSSVTTNHVYNTGGDIVAYEYWFDQDYTNKVSTSVTSGRQINLSNALNIDQISKGMHTFNLRFKSQNGSWSVVSTNHITKLGSSTQGGEIIGYRYWFDSDTTRTNVTLGFSAPTYLLFASPNMTALNIGTHTIKYQFRNGGDMWSSVIIDTFLNRGLPELKSITPTQGGNIGDVTVNIYGNGFFDSTLVRFINPGIDTIYVPDSMRGIIQSNRIVATLDLRGKPIGFYDVVVEVPEKDTVMVLPHAFEVVAGIPAHPKTVILGSSNLRNGVWEKYSIVVDNVSNVNATGVPVWIAIPEDVDFKLDYTFVFPSDTINWDTVSVFFETDTLFGEIKKYKIISTIIGIIPPYSNVSLSLSIKKNSLPQFSIIAWNSTPAFRSPLEQAKFNCVMDAYGEIFGIPPLFGCVYGLVDFAFRPIANQYLYNNPNIGGFGNLLWGAGNAVLGCVVNPVKGLNQLAKEGFKKFKETFEWLDRAKAGIDCADGLLPKDSPSKKIIQPVRSRDPNEKYGPQGAGLSNYIQGNSPLPYIIHFENVDTASAKAQNVLVLDTLDLNVFDISTFEFGSITIADTTINIPPGFKEFETYLDMRPRQNMVVHIKDTLDIAKGIASWQFTSLDPTTYEPVTDALAGFLPPNVNEPEGEGSVFFTIHLKDSTANNTVVANDAAIYFDNNPPEITAKCINTVDNIKPHSQVNPLPPVIFNDTVFTVSWGGTDTSSGISTYTIYYAVNGGTYSLWQLNTNASFADFTGEIDSSYSFYSIATDTAGNIEEAPFISDANTRLAISVGISRTDDVKANIQIIPNPSNGIFTVRLLNTTEDKCEYKIFNTLGVMVQYGKANIANTSTFKVDCSSLTKGQYYIQVSNDNMVWNRSVSIVK